MKKYKIELTEKQLMVYREALECYSRFLSGQLSEMCSAVSLRKHKRKAWDHAPDKDDPISDAAFKLKMALFPELPGAAAYGIGYTSDDKNSIDDNRQISYEMYREVYHYFAKEKAQEDEAKGKRSCYNVYLTDTLKYSDEPLPKVEEIEDDLGMIKEEISKI